MFYELQKDGVCRWALFVPRAAAAGRAITGWRSWPSSPSRAAQGRRSRVSSSLRSCSARAGAWFNGAGDRAQRSSSTGRSASTSDNLPAGESRRPPTRWTYAGTTAARRRPETPASRGTVALLAAPDRRTSSPGRALRVAVPRGVGAGRRRAGAVAAEGARGRRSAPCPARPPRAEPARIPPPWLPASRAPVRGAGAISRARRRGSPPTVTGAARLRSSRARSLWRYPRRAGGRSSRPGAGGLRRRLRDADDVARRSARAFRTPRR